MNEIQSLNVQLLTYKPDRQDMGDLKALAASIAEKGVIQPLLVRPASGAAPGEALKMVIVAGRRRYEAAKLAGLSEVPCIVLPADTPAEELSMIENTHRLQLSPMELHQLAVKLGKDIDPARALHQLDAAQGKRLAGLLNLSLRDTQRIIALGLCLPEVQKLVHQRTMPVSIALLTAGLKEEKVKGFLEYYRGQRPGYLDAKRHIEANQATKSLNYAPFDTKDCEGCPYRSGARNQVLFEDTAEERQIGGDDCYNPACWQKKYQEAKSAIKAQAVKLGLNRARVNVGGTYYGDAKRWLYNPDKAKDADACAECKLVEMIRPDGEKKYLPICSDTCPNRKDVKKSEAREPGQERSAYLSRAELEKLLTEGKPVPPAALREYLDARLDEAMVKVWAPYARKRAASLTPSKLPVILFLAIAWSGSVMEQAFAVCGLDDSEIVSDKNRKVLVKLDQTMFWAALRSAIGEQLAEIDSLADTAFAAEVLFGEPGWCAKHAPEIIKGLDKLGLKAMALLGKVNHPQLGLVRTEDRPAKKPAPKKAKK